MMGYPLVCCSMGSTLITLNDKDDDGHNDIDNDMLTLIIDVINTFRRAVLWAKPRLRNLVLVASPVGAGPRLIMISF